MKLGCIKIQGFIDFVNAGGFRIDIDEEIIKSFDRDKLRRVLIERTHIALDLLLDKMLDEMLNI